MKTVTFEFLNEPEWKFKVYVDGKWVITGDAAPDPLFDLLVNLEKELGFELEVKHRNIDCKN